MQKMTIQGRVELGTNGCRNKEAKNSREVTVRANMCSFLNHRGMEKRGMTEQAV